MISSGETERDTAPQTDWRVWQNADVALNFANERRAAIPGAMEQLETLRLLLPARPPDVQGRVGFGYGMRRRHFAGNRSAALDGSAGRGAGRFARHAGKSGGTTRRIFTLPP